VNDNSWHFIAIQRDSATYRLYVDSSAPVASGVGTISKYTSLVVGAQKDGSNFFDGLIDEVKLYDTAIEEASFLRSITPYTPYKLAVTRNLMNMRLSWVDESTTEQGFIIERKTKDTDWQELARVSANVMTYTDVVKFYNTEYTYRIDAYNSMGISAASNSVSITSPLDPNTGIADHGNNRHWIYPNPVKDKFTIISPENADIKLFDTHGNIMLSKKNCAANELFDMTNFSKGIYFLQTSIDNESDVIKLIKY